MSRLRQSVRGSRDIGGNESSLQPMRSHRHGSRSSQSSRSGAAGRSIAFRSGTCRAGPTLVVSGHPGRLYIATGRCCGKHEDVAVGCGRWERRRVAVARRGHWREHVGAERPHSRTPQESNSVAAGSFDHGDTGRTEPRESTGLVGPSAGRGASGAGHSLTTSVASDGDGFSDSASDENPFEPDESSTSSGSSPVGTPLSAGGLPGIPERATFGKRSTAGDTSGSGSVLPSGTMDVTQAAEAAASPPEIYWQAKVDPPPQPLEPKKGKIAVPFDTYSTKLIVPTGPSNFILVTGGYGKEQIWQVLDLRTAKQIGQTIIAGEDIDYKLAFSPDGRYVATELRGRNSPTIGVWSFATGQKVQEISPTDYHTNFDIAFGESHHIVISYKPEYNRTMVGDWNLQTGEKVQEMSFAYDNSERLARNSLVVQSRWQVPGAHHRGQARRDRTGDWASGRASATSCGILHVQLSRVFQRWSRTGSRSQVQLARSSGVHKFQHGANTARSRIGINLRLVQRPQSGMDAG